MEPQVFDNVKFEKEKALARFNRFRTLARVWQVFEFLVVFGLISWSSARFPAVLKSTAVFFVEFSGYLLNHHAVFLIGNAIVLLLFFLCRRSDSVNPAGDGDFYDDYVRHSEAAAHPRETALSPAAEEGVGEDYVEEKQIMVCSEDMAETPRDDVAAAIEKATRQIKKFQRTQSDKLRKEIGVRPRVELRRSETENCRRGVCEETTAEIDTLSSDEFRRTVDAFIDKHWIRRKQRHDQFEEFKNYQLVKSS